MTGETFARDDAGRMIRRLLGLFLIGLAFGAAGLSWLASNALALSPSVASKAAANVADTTATLNGSVNPNGLATTTYFEYGPTVSYGSKTTEVSAGSGSTALEIAKGVTGLTANTTYHYRVVAKNADGTSAGGDRTFTVGWNALSSPGSGTGQDVSCTAPDACTMVDSDSAFRWNGSEWKSQTVPSPAGGTSLTFNGVSCVSTTACTAVGMYKNSSEKWVTLIEFWNGTEWKVQSSPSPATTGAELADVSCRSTSECMAVGSSWTSGPPETDQTLAMWWNGSEWKLQTTPNPTANNGQKLTSVSCPTSTFCMAVGFYHDATFSYTPFSIRWTGSEWLLKDGARPSGSTMSWFQGVSCSSASSCIAVGTKEVDAGTHENQTMAQWWTGIAWSNQIATPNPGSNRNVEDVECVSAGFCTAIGYYTNGSGYTPFRFIVEGSGYQDLPMPAGGTKGMLFGVSCILSRGCMAVGHYWTVSEGPTVLVDANWRSAAPSVATTAATSVGEKAATLNGTVNPNGSETKVYFEYGTTLAYGSKSAEFNVGSGTGVVEQGAPLTGLSPATTYHYRIVGNNENPAISRGGDQVFRTTGPPTVSTLSAEVHPSAEAATLRGEVNPNGLSTTYQFEYGTSPGSYTKSVPVSPESAGSGTTAKLVTYTVTGLTKGTKYYYRLTASNSIGKSNGNEVSFSAVYAATLRSGKETIKTGTQLKQSSSNFTLSGYSCNQTEISGEVTENPGAKQAITTPKIQSSTGNGGCLWVGGLTIKFALLSAKASFDYKFLGGSGEVTVQTGKVAYSGTVYAGASKVSECEFNLSLSGTYKVGVSMVTTLSGTLELVKGGAFCNPGGSVATGTFTLTTTGGGTVEVGP